MNNRNPIRILEVHRKSGVGKTSLGHHGIKPYLHSPVVISIEDRNTSLPGFANEGSYSAAQFPAAATKIVKAVKDVVDLLVDVGSSNERNMSEAMDKIRGIEKFFNLRIVPTIPEAMIVKDTAATVNDLLARPGDPSEIIVVPNRVPFGAKPGSQAMAVFKPIMAMAAEKGFHVVSPVYESDLFEDLVNSTQTIRDLATAELDENDQNYAVKMVSRMQAATVEENLHQVWNEIVAIHEANCAAKRKAA